MTVSKPDTLQLARSIREYSGSHTYRNTPLTNDLQLPYPSSNKVARIINWILKLSCPCDCYPSLTLKQHNSEDGIAKSGRKYTFIWLWSSGEASRCFMNSFWGKAHVSSNLLHGWFLFWFFLQGRQHEWGEREFLTVHLPSLGIDVF